MFFIGNQKIINLLSRSLKSGQLNHAYIFSGPEHVGKFTLAKMFAIAAIGGKEISLDTENEDKDSLLDLMLIYPEVSERKGVVKKRDIPIEAVRDAKNSLSLFPYHGKYKILIIDEAHKMNVAAQNALLKILEEPNETTMIILVASEIGKILPTIQSRAQIINFSLASHEEMKKYFSEDIIDLSVGRPGLAGAICKDEEEYAFRIETKKQLKNILESSINDRLIMAENLSKDVVKVLEKLDVWTWEMRKNALSTPGNRQDLIFSKIEEIQKSIETLKSTNANARLVLEALFLGL